MNVDHILATLNRQRVAYLLIGGMNYLLRHSPLLTYDVDIWIEDTDLNLKRCQKALIALEAEWGTTEADWGAVSQLPVAWLQRQSVYCLTSPHGAIDIFKQVRGLDEWRACYARAPRSKTAAGTPYRGLSDADMLRSQRALDKKEQKHERVQTLRRAIARERQP